MTLPANGANGANPAGPLQFVFTPGAMVDLPSIPGNIIIRGPDPVTGAFSSPMSNVINFIPNSPLASGQRYRVDVIAPGITASGGTDPLNTSHSFEFFTQPTTPMYSFFSMPNSCRR